MSLSTGRRRAHSPNTGNQPGGWMHCVFTCELGMGYVCFAALAPTKS